MARKTLAKIVPIDPDYEPTLREQMMDGYSIFTTEYDAVVRPLDLMDQEELTELRKTLAIMCPAEHFMPGALAVEFPKPELDTCVTLLIDASGSMRGTPISFAVATAGIVAVHLEKLGIKVEVLAFTTRAWKGGSAYDKWMKEGKKNWSPGRLNDLRHIILKEADEPVLECIDNFSCLMREGLLKENIDGEALMWAYERIAERPEPRKIIMVLSDGAPVDDVTSAKMGPDFLAAHAMQVAALIHNQTDVELHAIGMLHNASRIYGVEGPIIQSITDLGPVVVEYLAKVLSGTPTLTNPYMAAWQMLYTRVLSQLPSLSPDDIREQVQQIQNLVKIKTPSRY